MTSNGRYSVSQGDRSCLPPACHRRVSAPEFLAEALTDAARRSALADELEATLRRHVLDAHGPHGRRGVRRVSDGPRSALASVRAAAQEPRVPSASDVGVRACRSAVPGAWIRGRGPARIHVSARPDVGHDPRGILHPRGPARPSARAGAEASARARVCYRSVCRNRAASRRDRRPGLGGTCAPLVGDSCLGPRARWLRGYFERDGTRIAPDRATGRDHYDSIGTPNGFKDINVTGDTTAALSTLLARAGAPRSP